MVISLVLYDITVSSKLLFSNIIISRLKTLGEFAKGQLDRLLLKLRYHATVSKISVVDSKFVLLEVTRQLSRCYGSYERDQSNTKRLIYKKE
jgi:hypothetical protein